MKYDFTLTYYLDCKLQTDMNKLDMTKSQDIVTAVRSSITRSIPTHKTVTELTEENVLKMANFLEQIRVTSEKGECPIIEFDIVLNIIFPDGYSKDAFLEGFYINIDVSGDPQEKQTSIETVLNRITNDHIYDDSLQEFFNIRMNNAYGVKKEDYKTAHFIRVDGIEFKPTYVVLKATYVYKGFSHPESVSHFFEHGTLAEFVNKLSKQDYRSSLRRNEVYEDEIVYSSDTNPFSYYDGDITYWDNFPKAHVWFVAYLYAQNKDNFTFICTPSRNRFILVLKKKTEMSIDSAIEATSSTLFRDDPSLERALKVLAATVSPADPFSKLLAYKRSDKDYFIESGRSCYDENIAIFLHSDAYTIDKTIVMALTLIRQTEDIKAIFESLVKKLTEAKAAGHTDLQTFVLDEFKKRIKANPYEYALEVNNIADMNGVDDIRMLAKMLLSNLQPEDIEDEGDGEGDEDDSESEEPIIGTGMRFYAPKH